MTARDVPPPLDELLARREWVRRFARTLARDDASADDLAQDAWVAAVERPPRHADAPAGWFRRVLVRRAMDVARGARRRASRENAASRADVAPATDVVVATAESHRRVVEAVMALDEPYRTTVLLRFFEDLPPRDVAARMNVPVETVRSRVRRAVELLRARLDEEHGGRRAAWLAPLLGDGRDAPTPTHVGLAAKGVIAMTAAKKAAAVVLVLLVLGAGVTAFVRRGQSVEADAATTRDAAAVSTTNRPRTHADAAVVEATPRSADAPAFDAKPVATNENGARDFVVFATDPTGRIVEGVRVGVHVKGGQTKRDTGSDFSITRTDASGRATFRVAGDVETAWAEPTDRSDYDFKGDKVAVAPGAADVRIVVERRAWIGGAVVGEDGLRVRGVDVLVLGRGRQVARTFTDDDGRFRVNVPPDGIWDLVLTGITNHVVPAGAPDLVGEAPGVPSGAESVSIAARPPSGKGPIHVRAETSEGRPLEGVGVVVMTPTSRVPVGAASVSARMEEQLTMLDGSNAPADAPKTDAAGRCDFANVPDRHVIVCAVSKTGEIPAWETAGWIKPWGVFVRPGADDVVLVFRRGRAIRGRVEFAEDVARPIGADGKRCSTMVLVQRGAQFDLVSTTWCDDAGRFTAWAPAGEPGPFRVSAAGWLTPDGRVFQSNTAEVPPGAEGVVLKLAETKH